MQLVLVEQIRHFPFSKNKSQSAGGMESTVTFLLSLALLSAAALLLFSGGKMEIVISDYASQSLTCPSGAVSHCRYPTVSRLGLGTGYVNLAAPIPELSALSGGWHVLCKDNQPRTCIRGAREPPELEWV